MEGSVYQRKDGRWVGVVDTGKDANGKRKQKHVYGKTKKETTIKLNNLVYELQNHIFRDPGNTTFGAFIDEWFEQNRSRWEETTAALYEMYIRKHIKPDLGAIKLKELLPMHLTKYYNDKLKEYSPNTVLKYRALIRESLTFAQKNNLILYNPADNADLPKKVKYAPTIYNDKQFKELLFHVQGTFDEIPILLAGAAGLRRGEVFGLRWRDINFRDKTITISETKVRFNKTIIKKPKNQTSNRTISVPDFIFPILENYRNSLKVIPERVCDAYMPQSYSEHFKKILENHNMPHIRFHDLRHFNAVIMMMYNIPDKVAAQRLGHSNTQTLREVYQHVVKDMDIDAAKKINELLK